MPRNTDQIADAIGTIVQRHFRAALYERLTRDVHETVNSATYPVISGIARLGPITASSLSNEIGLDRSIVSRRSAQLMSAGLVTRTMDATDARASLLTLTQAGQKVIGELRRRLATSINERLEAWPAADRDTLAELLSRFVQDGPL